LRIDALIEAARQCGADAIHPGYGFLAENASFARAVRDAGLLFIGPSAETIETMGLKTAARARMHAAGVPIVPGCELAQDASAKAQARAAQEVGYPLLVKASAGGGGKGMRSVEAPDQLAAAVVAARSEAAAAFGDPTVYLERRLLRPRHVEVQIFGDSHGQIVHLLERDCSLQRRHQKLVEESPAPGLGAKLRAEMHAAALAAARATGYLGAGTVEMLLDESGAFYFLEMNTRLQVEHPVTECVTGIDLVAEQIRVAEGHPLSFAQSDIDAKGHAIEVRLYAEDPSAGFLPQTGRALRFAPPCGPGLRVDAGIETGSEIALYYDPLLAKIVAHGRDRQQAIARLRVGLRETVLLGVGHNLEYLQAILGHAAFAQGEVHTGFLEQHLLGYRGELSECEREDALALAAFALLCRRHETSGAHASPATPSLWSSLGPLRLGTTS
jgi:geranyl-CoA carboxylase alpha subunit